MIVDIVVPVGRCKYLANVVQRWKRFLLGDVGEDVRAFLV